MKTSHIRYEVCHTHHNPDVTAVLGTENGKFRVVHFPSSVFQMALKLPGAGVELSFLQTKVAAALGLDPSFQSTKNSALKFIKQNTQAHPEFNGWCALFEANKVGNKVFYSFNSALAK